LGGALCWGATAQDTELSQAVPANTNLALSATAAVTPLAPWQQRLTLGPGDIVNLSIYGKKQFNRLDVPIGPDGRVSYLQASGVMAAGLTIDELRGKLTRELSAYFKNARVIVTPSAWRSKKYYLLGTIMDRGTYYLDQPMTIIEATARARGIATGLMEQNTVEIADLQRTFLVRQNRRLPVDFVKLFQQGDLSQNIQLEPGDYIYFPSSSINEVYVLGAVRSPGTVGVTDKASVLSVITTRGGFEAKAFKQRVLVVRGSLNQPETHIVDIGAVLAGKAKDFLVQPKDIVFVAERPWARVEELLDFAIKAFVVTATAEWVNQNVAPMITEPILPSP
jgi:protein involved in polysaccharide export with SLBB domain